VTLEGRAEAGVPLELCSERIVTHCGRVFTTGDKVDAAAPHAGAELGFAPVCADDAKPVGAVTDRDIAVRVCAGGPQGRVGRASRIMTREVLTCRRHRRSRALGALAVARRKTRIISSIATWRPARGQGLRPGHHAHEGRCSGEPERSGGGLLGAEDESGGRL
jgi:hypothetical protein